MAFENCDWAVWIGSCMDQVEKMVMKRNEKELWDGMYYGEWKLEKEEEKLNDGHEETDNQVVGGCKYAIVFTDCDAEGEADDTR